MRPARGRAIDDSPWTQRPMRAASRIPEASAARTARHAEQEIILTLRTLIFVFRFRNLCIPNGQVSRNMCRKDRLCGGAGKMCDDLIYVLLCGSFACILAAASDRNRS